MYSTWQYEETDTVINRRKGVVERAQQERDRRTNAIELTNTIKRQFEAELPPMTTAEFLSMAFRQRGIPCMDMFTQQVIGRFRNALGYDAHVDGHERKFLPLIRWECSDVVGTMWTIEPVAASFIMRGNSTDCESALKCYEGELEVIDAMSMTTTATSAKPGNELMGRWAGWILWRAAIWSMISSLTMSTFMNFFKSVSMIEFEYLWMHKLSQLFPFLILLVTSRSILRIEALNQAASALAIGYNHDLGLGIVESPNYYPLYAADVARAYVSFIPHLRALLTIYSELVLVDHALVFESIDVNIFFANKNVGEGHGS
ncbi:hypothetical protein LTR95_006902 [Oleoguttula sp. CCFEE 5521]